MYLPRSELPTSRPMAAISCLSRTASMYRRLPANPAFSFPTYLERTVSSASRSDIVSLVASGSGKSLSSAARTSDSVLACSFRNRAVSAADSVFFDDSPVTTTTTTAAAAEPCSSSGRDGTANPVRDAEASGSSIDLASIQASSSSLDPVSAMAASSPPPPPRAFSFRSTRNGRTGTKIPSVASRKRSSVRARFSTPTSSPTIRSISLAHAEASRKNDRASPTCGFR
mmetsp:Transcript_18646/g.43129  ORF Transcript_18646/g.43129 Transcript_18646/m.43129 type:complete len:227 (-) Transcript_18646:812-1492(-)